MRLVQLEPCYTILSSVVELTQLSDQRIPPINDLDRSHRNSYQYFVPQELYTVLQCSRSLQADGISQLLLVQQQQQQYRSSSSSCIGVCACWNCHAFGPVRLYVGWLFHLATLLVYAERLSSLLLQLRESNKQLVF